MSKHNFKIYKQLYRVVPLLLILGTLSYAKSVDYEYAVKWAREGEIEKSLNELKRLYAKYPDNENILYDYITVLGWGGFDDKVYYIAKNSDFSKAPDYLLQTVAKSARNMKKYSYAATLYKLGMKRFPRNSQFHIGYALTMFDAKDNKSANSSLFRTLSSFHNDGNVKKEVARTFEYGKEYFEAFRVYQSLLEEKGVQKDLVVRMVDVLRRLRMPYVAHRYIDVYPEYFDSKTLAAVVAEEAAYQYRWADAALYDSDEQKFELLESALKKIDKYILSMNMSENELVNDSVVKYAIFDKALILNKLERPKDVVALFLRYEKAGLKFPEYARLAVAESYLSLKRPYEAQRILEEIVDKSSDNFKAKINLFYAYSDAYDMDKAIKFAKDIDSKEPAKIWDSQHLYRITNPRKLDARMMRILSLEYAGYMDDAQKRLENLLVKAPNNGWLRNSIAQLYFYRGWYGKALEEFKISENMDPKDFDAKKGIALSNLMLRKYSAATSEIEKLHKNYYLRRASLKELRKSRDEVLDGGYSLQTHMTDTPSATTVGSYSGYSLKGEVYSRLIENRYRLNFDWKYTYAKYSGEKIRNSRYGIGGSYEAPKFIASATLSYNANNIKRLSPLVGGTYFFDDFFRFSGGYEMFTPSTPIRAIANGITANRLFASLSYRKSEAQESSVTLERLDFDDGNTRNALTLFNYTKLVEGPYYNLDSYIYSGVSDNSKKLTPYYNPDRNGYFNIEAKNSWLLRRFYDFSVKQIVALEAGVHWERGYGSNLTGILNVAQEWSLNRHFGFEFGYMRKRASYDGNIEYSNDFYFNISGRF